MASQEVIKELGTNGGGFYNANSAHPFENPTAWTNWLEIFLILLIPFSLPRVFGRMVGQQPAGLRDRRASWRILAIGSVVVDQRAASWHGTARCRRRSARRWRARRPGSACRTRRPSPPPPR